MPLDPTPGQQATLDRLAVQFDSLLVAPHMPPHLERSITVTCLDDVEPCDKHDDGVRLNCPECSFELRHQYIVDEAGAVRGGSA